MCRAGPDARSGRLGPQRSPLRQPLVLEGEHLRQGLAGREPAVPASPALDRPCQEAGHRAPGALPGPVPAPFRPEIRSGEAQAREVRLPGADTPVASSFLVLALYTPSPATVYVAPPRAIVLPPI